MKIVFLLVIVTLLVVALPLPVVGFNIKSEQNSVYRNAILQTLKKTPVVAKTSTFVPMPPPTRLPSKGKLDVLGADYPYNPTIHVFGNCGFSGAFHAFLAPISTWLIDEKAYAGENIRTRIAKELKRCVRSSGNVLDMCCGTGTSTRALGQEIDANSIIGLDTSAEMISMAQVLSGNNLFSWLFNSFHPSIKGKNLNYFVANAEDTMLPDASFDLVTIMYGFHEAPYLGRQRMLMEAQRLLQPGGTLAIVDISPDYQPSATMLAGEPFVLEYKKNIQRQLRAARGFESCFYREPVKGHVGLWLLKKSLLPFY